MNEEWREIPGNSSFYEASNLGRIRSVSRTVKFSDGRSRFYESKILKPTPDKGGYLTVTILRKTRTVHSLVLEAFVGPRPLGCEACHGVKGNQDNSIENLRWDTIRENRIDTVRHGNHNESNKTHCKNGHEFSIENTLLTKHQRVCLVCKRKFNREYKERVKQNGTL